MRKGFFSSMTIFKKSTMLICMISLLFSCTQPDKPDTSSRKLAEEVKTILIQPFDDLHPEKVQYVANEIGKIYPKTKILAPIHIPKESYYAPRNRYRADSIINIMRKKANKNEIIIGLTSKDISTTNRGYPDFGVMGLGYSPGSACVASNFRVKNNEQFSKVAIHELGHTQGLPHCPVKTCFMRDAESKNRTDELTGFCPKCKAILQDKNWKLN